MLIFPHRLLQRRGLLEQHRRPHPGLDEQGTIVGLLSQLGSRLELLAGLRGLPLGFVHAAQE